jgi:predicted phosphodiesterase
VSLADELATKAQPSTAALGKLAELLERNGIGIDDIGRVAKVNLWQGFHKDDNGDAQVVDLAGISFSPTWETGPEWPVVQPGPAVKVSAPKVTKPPTDTRWKTALILPDIQAGYYRGMDGDLVPIHDLRAIEVAVQIAKVLQPDQIIMVGDNLDGCELGKYRHTPAYQFTTQATIDWLTVFCATLRATVPHATIKWLEGNHEARLGMYILDNAKAAFGLRRGDMPASWPVMSIPFLCRLDESGVEYVPGYPASQCWINERLRVVHGDRVASGGSTAHKYLATEKTSVIYGHIHRREWAERTRDDYDGPKTILAASPGCLARTDGSVPSTRGGVDLDGRPVPRPEDWQQGVAVVTYEEGDGRFVYEQIAIHDGWASWRGREYVA